MSGEGGDRFPSDAELTERIAALARHCSVFEDPGFRFGEWTAPQVGDDGVIQLGWHALSPEADAFIRDAYEAGCIVDFDWPTWAGTPRARALAADPDAVAAASPGDVVRLLTALVRGDRFSEGYPPQLSRR